MHISNSPPFASAPRIRLRSLLTAMVGALLLTGALLTGFTTASAADIFTLYLSPTGSDSNNGLSPQSPLKTLDGAQSVLVAANPNMDVEVRIAAGTYVATAAPKRWEFYIPGHSISFMPATYQYGVKTAWAQEPIFHGPDTAAWWFQAELPAGDPGGDTNLHFYDLVVEHYSAGGMNIAGPMTTNSNGIAVPASAGLNHNVINGLLFRDGGSVAVPAHYGWGGLDFTNSSNNTIINSQFRRLENSGSHSGQMHGVYLAHFSSNNEVYNNVFQDISSDPVRVRNQSNFNSVHDNTFQRTGSLGYFSDWFCDTGCVADNPGHTRECASHANDFANNVLDRGYNGGSISTFAYYQGGSTYAGGTGCSLDGYPRLSTRGNHAP